MQTLHVTRENCKTKQEKDAKRLKYPRVIMDISYHFRAIYFIGIQTKEWQMILIT